MYLIFDTETTGLPRDFKAAHTDTNNWPRVVQLAWQLHDLEGNLVENKEFLIKPDGFVIPYESQKVHGISTELAEFGGTEMQEVLLKFDEVLKKASFVVGHNLQFDLNVLGCEYVRQGQDSPLQDKKVLDTCTEKTAELCQLSGGRKKFKMPKLEELYFFLFNNSFAEAHNATADVEATARCFFELIRKSHYTLGELLQPEGYLENFKKANPNTIELIGLTHQNLKKASAKLKKSNETHTNRGVVTTSAEFDDAPYAHLHNHSQFTLLQSTSEIKALIAKAVEFNMPAIALTDNGNMMAAFQFEKLVSDQNEIIRAEILETEENGAISNKQLLLPIIGCEFNVCKDHTNKSVKDYGSRWVFLAKNKNGYQNLIKLASIAYTQGFYYLPRIDRALVEKYHEDVIVLSGGHMGEISNLILNVGETQAEESLLWWKSLFGEDLYLEINRHGLESEDVLNEVLLRFADKHGVKLIASNNSYYVNREDAVAHDVLLCVKEGALVNTPIGKGMGKRFGFENNEYYFKSPQEMKQLFADIPQAIFNIQEIVDKCEAYSLSREVLLPKFDIPEAFIDPMDDELGTKNGENGFLRHLAYEGAARRYGEISDAIRERMDFELKTIENTGYPGYFLIVQDFCTEARKMGVSVGPGRGSAAGSVVAYCTGITNVDPIKYDLLFERFLNPDRISMPDIDIDFDDEGRGKVIDYVIQKYGSSQVAQIITYGTMAAKSAIRDTARVMNLPLPEADRLAKLVPDISLKNLFSLSEPELADKLKHNMEAIGNARSLRSIFNSTGVLADVLGQAKAIEGSVRNIGIHACGVIITPDDITNFVPVATAKDSDMVCTQFDNAVAESAGLLKMDFLGLKTLTLIKVAVKIIKEIRGVDLDPDQFPIDDEATYALFQRGETIGIFQYESPGMQKYMRELKPTEFADLIAMNALYRPGPLEYIPSFIKRKHGEEEITYDLADCEEYLKETYGITVYQEQVMLLSQKIADFTKGEADTLRKAMGKKDRKVLDKMKPLFLERGTEKGHASVSLEKIWKDWEAFASYAFNKSHSTCYAWIAYQTAYLKANYPAEYMASVLSNNMSDMKQVTFFMEECRRMGVEVLGPDVNESNLKFTVNEKGAIRFGLGGIKGIGEGPVEAIVEGRKEGPYLNVFDFFKRINHKGANRNAIQNLIYAGALDTFSEMHRAQYFHEETNRKMFLEILMKWGQTSQDGMASDQTLMFQDTEDFEAPTPNVPVSEEWSSSYKLSKEREAIGIFISGHPLDDFRVEIDSFCTGNLSMFKEMDSYKGKDLTMAVIVTSIEHRLTKTGEPFGTIVFEDYTDQYKLNVFRESYLKFKHLFTPGIFLTLYGRFEVPKFRKELEFSLNSVSLLQELREKRAKLLELKIPNKELNHELIDHLNALFTKNQGNCSIQFTIVDAVEGLELNMTSKSVRINPDPTLYKELTRLNVQFKLT